MVASSPSGFSKSVRSRSRSTCSHSPRSMPEHAGASRGRPTRSAASSANAATSRFRCSRYCPPLGGPHIIPRMYVSAILAAGGRGLRLGHSQPKQLLEIAGRPILERSVSLLQEHPEVHEVIVALPEELVEDPPAYLLNASKPLRVVKGGARRQ